MKIKKLISLFLAFTLSVTSTVNCFAVGSDSASSSESEESLSDIEFPDRVEIDSSLEEQIEHNAQRLQQLLEQRNKSDAQIVELKAIYELNKAELDELNKMLCDAIKERDDYKLRLDVQREISRASEEDIMCTNCICCRNPISEVTSLIRGDINPIPSSSMFRSKRFYKGVLTGAIIVAVVLVGIYVYVYYIHAPARSE